MLSHSKEMCFLRRLIMRVATVYCWGVSDIKLLSPTFISHLTTADEEIRFGKVTEIIHNDIKMLSHIRGHLMPDLLVAWKNEETSC